MSLSNSHLSAFEMEIAKSLRPSTITNYLAVIRRFAHYLGEEELLEASQGDVVRFLQRVTQDASGQAANFCLSALRRYFSWAQGKGLRLHNPTAMPKHRSGCDGRDCRHPFTALC